MPAPYLTYDQLLALSPCGGRLAIAKRKIGGPRKWNWRKITAAQARDAGMAFDDILWAASAMARKDADVDRRLRLWMADCAARVLHIYEKTEASDAPRKAIIAARQYARGEIGAAARDDARDAAWAAGDAAWDDARAAWAAGAAARAAEEAWQFDRLIAWMSDEEPNDWPLPERQRGVA